MKTEARFLLAIVLMLGVLVGTNLIFPPVEPEAVPGADSLGVSEAAPPGTPSETPSETPADPILPPSLTDEVPVVAAAPEGGTVEEVLVEVEGPLYRYTFSSVGARLVGAEMSQFVALNREGVVDLVPPEVGGYMGQKLLVGSDTVDLTGVPFEVIPAGGLVLNEGSGASELRFVYQHPTRPFRVEVAYEFHPDEYPVKVRGKVEGVDRPLLITHLGDGLAFAEADSVGEARAMAYVSNHVQDGVRSRPMQKAEIGVIEGPLLWAAFRSKFFVMALLAGESEELVTDATYLGGLLVSQSPFAERVNLSATQSVGQDGTFAYRLFLGPQEYALLSSLGEGMEEVNPYGWKFFRPIVRPIVSVIMAVLVFLHSQLSLSYGWVLILFGVMMRVVLWPLNQKAMKAQLRNMAVQPLMKEIQEKYKDNQEKLQKEMMKLYKDHGFNPLAGCLPMLLPWPVLIALFFVFQNTIELRGVPFLWLPDLSAPDPLYLLPVFLGVSMFLMQYVSYKSLDQENPQMKMMMYIMPIFMVFIFFKLASGLNLYYATANIATIPQQIWIAGERRKMKGKPPPRAAPSKK